MKNKTQFHFKYITIHYNLHNQADEYYHTKDNEYNKSINWLLIDRGYKRLLLHKSDGLVEIKLGFNYEWHWVYYRDDGMYEANRETREQIRKVPVLSSNIPNELQYSEATTN